MPTETVTVAFVNEPKAGKKFGSIKTDAGVYYSVKPSELPLFKPGGTYEIQFGFDKTNTYRNFERIVGASPKNQETVNGKDEAMFMTGFVNRLWASTGVVPPEADIEAALRNAQNAWRRVHDGGEEIPY